MSGGLPRCFDRWPSKREAGGLDAGWLTLLRLQLPGRQRTAIAGLVYRKPIDYSEDFRTGVMADEVDPSSLLNSACYRFADFIFASSARARSASSA
jgi:hypothetical protein